jgi:penicillin amidase
MVYADTAGHIGYQAPGAIPIRRDGRLGDYPVAGWLPRNDWTGRYIPFRDLPHVLDPPEGFIVTANQAVTGPTYPYYLTNSPDMGYRSQRIRTVLRGELEHGGKVSPADMAALQLDDQNPVAPVLVPYLMRQLMTSEYDADGQRLLSEWDYSQPADSAAAAYFNAVWSNLLRLTFDDDLPESLWPDGGDRWIAVMSRLLQQPQSTWWDNQDTEGVVENRDMILSQAMRDARTELTVRTGESPSTWKWGRLHGMELENQSVGQSSLGLVRALFNRGPYPVGGGESAVDATSWNATEGYEVTTAPSMRMVVDLAHLDRSRWISLTGASGHPASSHYTDQTDLWVQGKTLPWLFSPTQVRRAADHILTLKPRRGG